MAEKTAFESKTLEKYPLMNVSMNTKIFRSGREIVYSRIDWKIRNFRKLSKWQKYITQLDPQYSPYIELSLVKVQNNLNIEMCTERQPATSVTCFVVYNKEEKSEPIHETRNGDRLEFTIPWSVIGVPENKLYQKGHLTLQFQYDEYRDRNFAARSAVGSTKRSKEFEDKLLEFDPQHLTPDFRLYILRKEFLTWKAFLAARSGYFYRLFEEQRCKRYEQVDTTFVTLKDMMQFIHYGRIKKPNTLKDSMDLFKLTVRMEVPSLLSVCEVALKLYVDHDNALAIRSMAEKCEAEGLVTAIDYYLE